MGIVYMNRPQSSCSDVQVKKLTEDSLPYFKRILAFILVVSIQYVFCSVVEAGNTHRHIEGIRTDGHVEFINSEGNAIASINVEIADTKKARGTGLMQRTGLDNTMGMLFIFGDVDHRAFWMVNTPTPLDIIFVSEAKQVINIATNTKPMSKTVYHSKGPVKYAIEVVAGFCARNDIQVGTRINWQRK